MNKSRLLFILNNLFDFLLVCVLLINLYNIAMRNIYHRQIPMLFDYGYAVVVSGSMSPAFDVDDVVYIKHKDTYEVGDIITFIDENSPEQSLVTHRIIEETEDGFITKGDANNTADDGIVKPESIQGCVAFVMPFVGASVLWMRKPVGTLVMILLALLLIELPYQIRTRTKRASQETISEIRDSLNPEARSKIYAPDLFEDDSLSDKEKSKIVNSKKRPKVYVPEEGQWDIDR